MTVEDVKAGVRERGRSGLVDGCSPDLNRHIASQAPER